VKCTEYRSLIDAYIDDALDAKAERQFTAHTESCPSCRQELRIAKKIRKTLSTMKAPSAPRNFEERVKARIAASQPSTLAKIFLYPRYIKIPLAAAAMIAIAFSVMFKNDVFTGSDHTVLNKSKADMKIASADIKKPENESKDFYASKSSVVRRAAAGRMADSLAKDSSPAQANIAASESTADEQSILDVEIVVASNIANAAALDEKEREKQKEAKTDDITKGASAAVAMRNEESSYDKKAVQKSAPAPSQQQKNRALQRSDLEQAAKGAGGTLNTVQGTTVNIQIPGKQLPQLKKELSNYGTVKQKSGKVKDTIVLEVTPAE
jgi:hypothetical protein